MKPAFWRVSPLHPPPEQYVSHAGDVTGIFRCDGDFHWNGIVRGVMVHGVGVGEVALQDSNIPPTLWLEGKSRVVGTVIAHRLIVHGEVEGDIYAKELHISSFGKVFGRVVCDKLRLDFGGVLEGRSTTRMPNMDTLMQEQITQKEAELLAVPC